MEWLQFSYHSIGIFPVMLINLFMAIFLLLQKNKSRASMWLGGVFVFYSIMFIGFFLSYSIFSPYAAYHRYLTTSVIFANASFIGFAYNFPKNDKPKEAKIVIPFVWILASIVYFEFMFNTLGKKAEFNFSGHMYSFEYGTHTGVFILLYQLWIIVLLFRKVAWYSSYSGFFSKWVDYNGKNPIQILKKYFAIIAIHKIKFLFPNSNRSKASRAFAFCIILYAVAGILNVLNKSGMISYNIYSFIFSNLAILVSIFIILTYINNSLEPTTFMIKLIGISLVTMLSALGYAANITLAGDEKTYDFIKKTQINNIKKSILKEDFENIPSEISYIIYRNSDEDFLHSNFNIIYISPNEKIDSRYIKNSENNFKLSLIGDEIKSLEKLYPNREEDSIEKEAIDKFKSTRIYKNLHSDYSVEFKRLYRSFGNNLFAHYDFIQDNRRYEVGYNYINFREYIHENAKKQLLIILGTSIVTLLLFPAFFHSSLVNPLNTLLRGVEKVNKGDLEVEVGVKILDEIGYLSQSFNSMVKSIRQARIELQDYADNLEVKVKERTREVQEKMEEVQRLKVHQDGDYFLTTLITNPLMQNRNKSQVVKIDFFIEQKKKFHFKGREHQLGGDICISGNLNFSGNKYVMFFNGDAMGKSMQGAGGALVIGSVMNSIMARSARDGRVITEMNPENWLHETYVEIQRVMEAFNGSMLVSCILGIIEEATGKMIYFNAEHPFSILFRDGKAEFIEKEISAHKIGMPINEGCVYYTYYLQKGDIVFCGSDGKDDLLIEHQMNENEKLILSIIEKSEAQLPMIYSNLKSHGELSDDLSIVRVFYDGPIENINTEPVVNEDKTTSLPYPDESIKEMILGKRFSEALSEMKKNSDEDNVTLLFWKAYCLNKLKENKQSLELMEKASQYLKQNKMALKLLGKIYYDLRDFEKSKFYLNRTLDLFPDDESSKVLLAKIITKE